MRGSGRDKTNCFPPKHKIGSPTKAADDYDAAQERGEVQQHGGLKSNVGDHNVAPSAADIGLRRDEISELRFTRRMNDRV